MTGQLSKHWGTTRKVNAFSPSALARGRKRKTWPLVCRRRDAIKKGMSAYPMVRHRPGFGVAPLFPKGAIFVAGAAQVGRGKVIIHFHFPADHAPGGVWAFPPVSHGVWNLQPRRDRQRRGGRAAADREKGRFCMRRAFSRAWDPSIAVIEPDVGEAQHRRFIDKLAPRHGPVCHTGR